jgi:hypothetical protein
MFRSILHILNFQRWKLAPSYFSMTFKDSIWKEHILNANALQTIFQKIKSFGRKSLTPHVNLKRKKFITCKSLVTQAWNFTWNLQPCKKLSLT